jgi:hypothetical protein
MTLQQSLTLAHVIINHSSVGCRIKNLVSRVGSQVVHPLVNVLVEPNDPLQVECIGPIIFLKFLLLPCAYVVVLILFSVHAYTHTSISTAIHLLTMHLILSPCSLVVLLLLLILVLLVLLAFHYFLLLIDLNDCFYIYISYK